MRYLFRYDPKLGKKRLFAPGEPLPEYKEDKSNPKYMNIQIRGAKDGDELNHGLGVAQRDVPNKLKEIEGETGTKLVEVGNDHAGAQLGSNNNNYKFSDSEMRQIHQELGNGTD